MRAEGSFKSSLNLPATKVHRIYYWAFVTHVVTVITVNSVTNVVCRVLTQFWGAMSNTRLSRGAASGSRLRRVRSRFVAVAVALTVLVTGSIVGAPSDSAWARDYPTWDDVSAVRNDEAAAKTNMTRLRGRAPRGERVMPPPPVGTGKPPR